MKVSIQKSFLNDNLEDSNKSLFLIATPIGNLSEISERAVELLKNSQLIVCESVNSCRKLLAVLSIGKKRLISYDNIKEKSEYLTTKVLEQMLQFEKISLVSNAGYPLVSDPGRVLVRRWIDLGYHVIPVSGSSALINAVVASGFYFHRFTFLGFLSRNKTKQKKTLSLYSAIDCCLIIYESGQRIISTLSNIRDSLGNRLVALCRELTKIHEEFIRGDLKQIISLLLEDKIEKLGEFVIIVSVELAEKNNSQSFVDELIRSSKKK